MSYFDDDYAVTAADLDLGRSSRLRTAILDNDVDEVGAILTEVMDRSQSTVIRDKMENLRAQVLVLLEQAAKLQAIPPEPTGDVSPPVIYFEKTFGSRRKWSYAAVRPISRGFWYVTSTQEPTRRFPSWVELWDFIQRGERVTPTVQVATAWRTL